MCQRGEMAATAVLLFVSVASLPSVKSGGHWSESASHWLFLYVKPFNVALRRYHETYFTSWLFPTGGISSRLRGLPQCTHVSSFGIVVEPGNNPPLNFAKLSATWQEPCKYQPYCWCFLTPVGAVNCQRSVSATRQEPQSMNPYWHGHSKWRTVCPPAAWHHSHRTGLTWQYMKNNDAHYVSLSSPSRSQNLRHF